MTKTKWGILSTARIGKIALIPALHKAENCHLVAIASRNREQAEKVAEEFGISKAYGSYEKLLADPEIEVIYNPLPNNMHLEWTIKALRAGKHVLCEKPIGMNTAEALNLQKEKEYHPNLKLMEAFMYRFHPQWIKAKEMVDAGEIGEVKSVQSFFTYFKLDRDNIRNQPEAGGGGLMDIGCYCISFPRFIFGAEPKRVSGLIDYDPDMKIDRHTSALLDFGDGTNASFVCSTQLMRSQKAQIFGSKARIEIEIPVNVPADEPSEIKIVTEKDEKTIRFLPADQYQLQVEAFANCILNGTPEPTPFSDAIGNMKVIDAVFESARRNEWVNIG